MGPGGVNDVMHQKRGLRILGIGEKSVSWVLASEEDGWLSGLVEALRRVPHVVVVVGGGGRWKSQHRKIVYLSPYVEKPFNLKVMDIMNVLRTGMNMSISPIHIWLCNKCSFKMMLQNFIFKVIMNGFIFKILCHYFSLKTIY